MLPFGGEGFLNRVKETGVIDVCDFFFSMDEKGWDCSNGGAWIRCRWYVCEELPLDIYYTMP